MLAHIGFQMDTGSTLVDWPESSNAQGLGYFVNQEIQMISRVSQKTLMMSFASQDTFRVFGGEEVDDELVHWSLNASDMDGLEPYEFNPVRKVTAVYKQGQDAFFLLDGGGILHFWAEESE